MEGEEDEEEEEEVEVVLAERVKFSIPVCGDVEERLLAVRVRTKAPLGRTEVRERDMVVEVFVRERFVAWRRGMVLEA